MQLGTRIQELMTEKGITQRKLAADLHLNPNTVNGYIQNRRMPDCDTIVKIAIYLDTNIDYLLGITNLKHFPELSLSREECILLDNYRSMSIEHREILTAFSATLQNYSQAHSTPVLWINASLPN